MEHQSPGHATEREMAFTLPSHSTESVVQGYQMEKNGPMVKANEP